MTDTRFPVASFAEAIPYLRAPYTPELVSGRVVSAPDNDRAPCDIALYVSSETVMSRLNIVCDLNWEVNFEKVAERTITSGEKTLYYVQIRAHVTVFGRTFEDLGEATEDGQAMAEYKARAQSFKRAARWFEVGHCLYSVGKILMWRGPGDHQLRVPKSGENPHKRPYLDERSERYIRQQYEKRLEDTVERIYGEPLDHHKAAQGRIATTQAQVPPDASFSHSVHGDRESSHPQHVHAPGMLINREIAQTAADAGFSETITRQLTQLARDEEQVGELIQPQIQTVLGWINDLGSLSIAEETARGMIDFTLERSAGRQAARTKFTEWIAAKAQAAQEAEALTSDDRPPSTPPGAGEQALTTTDGHDPDTPPRARAMPNGALVSATFATTTPDESAGDRNEVALSDPSQPALEQLTHPITLHGYEERVVQRLIALSRGQGPQTHTAWEALPEARVREIARLLSCAAQIGWDDARLDQMVMRAHTSAQQNTPAGRYAAFDSYLTSAAQDRATETAHATAGHEIRNAA